MSRLTMSRSARALTAVAVGAAGLAVATATPAAAAPHYDSPAPIQVGYTDSADRKTAFEVENGVGIPLGASTDANGRAHVSRVYVTFDLDKYVGKRITRGLVVIGETGAADCTKRAIEIWSTDTIDKTPSWSTAPVAEQKLYSITTGSFCSSYLAFDVAPAIAKAVTKQKPRVTFEIRVPANVENDVTFGRTLSSYQQVGLTVGYNSAPVITPADRYAAGFPCDGTAPYPAINNGLLQARATDADPEQSLKYDFAVWLADDPAARVEMSDDVSGLSWFASAQVPSPVTGKTYLWQVRAGDGVDTSAWSQPCGFVWDSARPSAPQVTSSNVPEDGEAPIGEPGVFTFSGHGDTDVAAFEYTWDEFSVPGCTYREWGRLECQDPLVGQHVVRADAAGGSATVNLTPPSSGPIRLRVRSVDAAGNRSEPVEYRYYVSDGAPVVTVVGDEPEFGRPVTLRFAPHEGVTGTVDYTYVLDDAAPVVVPAGAIGTATVTFTVSGSHFLTVRSRSASGWVSGEAGWQFRIDPWPTVRSAEYPSSGEPVGGVGVPGTFTFTPSPGTTVQGYRYAFAWDQELVFVPADAAGLATITWTPTERGFYALEVYAVDADGNTIPYSAYYTFVVA